MTLLKSKLGIINLDNALRIDCYVERASSPNWKVCLAIDMHKQHLWTFESEEDAHRFRDIIDNKLFCSIGDANGVIGLNIICNEAAEQLMEETK